MDRQNPTRLPDIVARRTVQKMRGGSQAHLIEASDGHFYVVKFQNNPQHLRILVNEWISTVFLSCLGLSTPEAVMIRVTADFLQSNPETYLQLGSRRLSPTLGWHFGSRFPGDPAHTAVYDFLPESLLTRTGNLSEFAGVLAFDKWVGNADARQAIFFRPLAAPTCSGQATRGRLGFIGQMMDHGHVFGGPHWRLTESPLQGLYSSPLVYRSVRGLADFEPWLERIQCFPEAVVDQALKDIPHDWLEEDQDALERLLERLMVRRKRLPQLIEGCRQAPTDPFPAWQDCIQNRKNDGLRQPAKRVPGAVRSA